MFDVYCPGHGCRVLLGPRSIEALVNTDAGIEIHWKCRCGTRGVLRTGAAVAERTGSKAERTDRDMPLAG